LNNSLNISVVTYDLHEAQLGATLRALQTALNAAVRDSLVHTFKTFVIDNGNNSRTLSRLLKGDEFSGLNLTLIENSTNIGFGAAHNVAIRKYDSNYHLILNPDAELHESALRNGIELLRNRSDATVIGARGLNESGKELYLAKRYPSLLVLLVRGIGLKWLDRLFARQLDRYECHDLIGSPTSCEVPIVSGCMMLCRSDPLIEVGGFDERYFLYFEDFDLCQRLSSHRKILYSPDVMVIHHGGNASRKGISHVLHFVKSALVFFSTHGWRLV